METANNILFRASSNGHLMVEPKTKSELIAQGVKTHLVDVFVSYKYGRKTEINTKYINKGLQVEEDSITLYSRAKKTFLKKNEVTLSNEFICGTPDLYLGKSIEEAEEIIDIKSSWDIFTFFRAKNNPLNKMYYWQLQSYMALTGAKKSKLVYCLIDTPHAMIEDEKYKLRYKMGVIDPNNEDYINACNELERSMIYDDIPLTEKYFEIEVLRCDEDIERLYSRITTCREWMNLNLFI